MNPDHHASEPKRGRRAPGCRAPKSLALHPPLRCVNLQCTIPTRFRGGPAAVGRSSGIRARWPK
eukprot:3872196-Lingulodinium_polyedra.AAC.1